MNIHLLIYLIYICDIYSLPADLDDDARHFFKSVLEKDLTRRPNAENSLKLPFFSKYIIPPTLPDDIWNLKCVDQPKRIPNDPTSIFHGIFFEMIHCTAFKSEKIKSIVVLFLFDSHFGHGKQCYSIYLSGYSCCGSTQNNQFH